jgi:hypothetical protein
MVSSSDLLLLVLLLLLATRRVKELRRPAEDGLDRGGDEVGPKFAIHDEAGGADPAALRHLGGEHLVEQRLHRLGRLEHQDDRPAVRVQVGEIDHFATGLVQGDLDCFCFAC